jgi:hypothetical protein
MRATRRSNRRARRTRRCAQRGGERKYGKADNASDGYSGAFCGQIKDAAGVARDEHYFWDIDEGSHQYIDEKLQAHIAEHVKEQRVDLDANPEFFCQAGYGGDRGGGKVEFLLDDKIAKPPPLDFTYMGEKYTMIFKFCA